MVSSLDRLETPVEIQTEVVDVCPLCGDPGAKLLFWNYDRLYRFSGEFGTLECEQCHFIRLSPRPTVDTIKRHYPEGYGAYVPPPFATQDLDGSFKNRARNLIRNSVLSTLGYQNEALKGLQKLLRPVFVTLFFKHATYGFGEFFPRSVPNGRALEVGCGNGNFLSRLKRHGWHVNGVDLSAHAVAAAKQNFDIDVFHGQLDDAPFPAETFDYIHLSHVVEHFFDPLKTMKKVRDLLKPGGIIYIEVPNAASVSVKISKEFWYGWDPPRHLFMFTPETLDSLLQKAGLKRIKVRTRMWNSFDWAYAYKQEDVSGKIEPERLSLPLKARFVVAVENIRARVDHFFHPDQGDNILCIAERSDAHPNE